jgi:hypothetical protein
MAKYVGHMVMSNADSLEIEISPISGRFARSGTAVNVCIYRPRAIADDNLWILEVVSEEGKSRVFEDLFATDQDAFKAFYQVVERGGVAAVLTGDRAGRKSAGSSQ